MEAVAGAQCVDPLGSQRQRQLRLDQARDARATGGGTCGTPPFGY